MTVAMSSFKMWPHCTEWGSCNPESDKLGWKPCGQMARNSQGMLWTSADSSSSGTVAAVFINPKAVGLVWPPVLRFSQQQGSSSLLRIVMHIWVPTDNRSAQMESRDLPASTWMYRPCVNMSCVGCPVLLLSSCCSGLKTTSGVYIYTHAYLYTHTHSNCWP